MALYFGLPFTTYSQVDTARFDKMYDVIDSLSYEGQLQEALSLIYEFVDESKAVDYTKGIIYGYQDWAWIQVELGNADKADSLYQIAITTAMADNNPKQIGYTYQRMVAVSKLRAEPYEALERFEKSIDYYIQAGDSSHLCEQYLSMGNYLIDLDEIDLGVLSYEKALEICGAIGDLEYKAFTLSSMGIAYAKVKLWDLADSTYLAALDVAPDSKSLQLGVLNNRGILKKDNKQYGEAMALYQEAIDLKPNGFQMAGLLANRAKVLIEVGALERAKIDAQNALQYWQSTVRRESVANSYNLLTEINMAQSNFEEALVNVNNAISHGQEARSLDKLSESYALQSKIYAALGRYQSAYEAGNNYISVRDTFDAKNSAEAIKMVEQKYANTIERKENALLKKEVELASLEQSRWRLALLGVGAFFAFILIALLQKRRKDRKLYRTEKALSEELLKRQSLEKEQLQNVLELKKQELLASTLQIHNKNKVLVKLKDQLQLAKVENGSSIGLIDKLSRQIKSDLESDGEWENFLQSFCEIHQDFYNQLNQEFPDLTNHQIRLICLIKMNLNTLEVCNILNISNEGVKKARHRLKKKLGLSTGQKLEQFVHSLAVTQLT